MTTPVLPAAAGVRSPSAVGASGSESKPRAAQDSFADAFGRLIEATDAASGAANESILRMLERNADVHDAMIALTRAELSLQFTVQVRNKLVQAYQEIMRMSI
jgi:flagellar hook-basal body complex protein FliE